MEFWNANATRIGQRFFVRKGETSLEDIDTRLRDREQPSTISICETTGRLYRSYFSAVIRNNIAIYVRTAEPISGSLLRNASPCSSFTWTELEHVGFDPAPFDLGGFSGSSQYRLPIICSTIAAIYRKSPYKPIFLPILVADMYHKMEGFARIHLGRISGFFFWNFSNLFENKRASFDFILEYFYVSLCYYSRICNSIEYDECESRPIIRSKSSPREYFNERMIIVWRS